jgi:hypothetical protein
VEFKRFSSSNSEALKLLRPDLGLKSWNDYSKEDKNKIWKYLEKYFFDKEKKYSSEYTHWGSQEMIYQFYGNNNPEIEYNQEKIVYSILALNDEYKAKSYGLNYLEKPTLDSACTDFYNIFSTESEEVVLEMISFYVEYIFRKKVRYSIPDSKSDFRDFANGFNETLSHFNFKYTLTDLGFVPKVDPKISENIYDPVIEILANDKWKAVSDHLRNAFSDIRKNKPEDFSTCVTKTVSAIQAYLQIVVHGETGKGDISTLIEIAHKRKFIPSDSFSKAIFIEIQKFLAIERKNTSDAHPKKEYATEHNARLVLNLAMVFIQHCITYKP